MRGAFFAWRKMKEDSLAFPTFSRKKKNGKKESWKSAGGKWKIVTELCFRIERQ